MTGRIFISYRRTDSQYATDRIYERLSKHFGPGRVFMDIDNIPLGVNFRTYIDQQISTSDIVLAVIGDHWLNARDSEGNLRLQNPSDFVRLEIEAAFNMGIQVIPIFIGGVLALPADRLPDSLQELPMLNATRIRRGDDFLPDVDRLIRGIEHISKSQTEKRDENKAVLMAIENSASEIISQLSSLEALLIQEMRKRTQLEKEAQRIAAQAHEHLKDPGKQLRVDVGTIEQQVEKLQDSLVELSLQIEERKQAKLAGKDPPSQTPVWEAEPTKEAVEPAPAPPDTGKTAVPRKTRPPKRKRVKSGATPSQSIDLKKIFRSVPIWIWGAVAVVVLGVVFGPMAWTGISSAIADRPAAAPETLVPDETSSTPASNPTLRTQPDLWFIEQMKEFSNSTPDYIEDFSIPQPYWSQRYDPHFLIADSASNGVLNIVDVPDNETRYYFVNFPGVAEDFILQFEFTPQEIGFGSELVIDFNADEFGTNSFTVRNDGEWRFWRYAEDITSLELGSGTTAALLTGQTYQFQVFAWDSQMAVLINDELVTYAVDDWNINKGGLRFGLVSYKPINVLVDNIEFWDLSDDDLNELPTPDSVKSFYTPVREYLAVTAPDFEEEFETPQPYWDEMQVDFSDTKPVDLAVLVADGALHLNSIEDEDDGHFRLFFPKIQATTYAIRFDFQFTDPENSDRGLTAAIEGWGTSGNQEGYSPYCDFHTDERVMGCGLYKLLRERSDLVELNTWTQAIPYFDEYSPHTMFVVFYDGQFVSFLDGYLVAYAGGLELFDQILSINIGHGEHLKKFDGMIDNIKFWNLDGISMQEFIASQPPTFEDDFSTQKAVWDLTDTSEIDITVGRLMMTAANDRDQRASGDHLAASSFLLQYDFLIEGDQETYTQIVFGEPDILFELSMNGEWAISKGDVISSGSANNFLLEEWNTLEIFVWGDQIETSLNDELLTTFNETIPDEEIALGSDSVTHGNVSIDNLRFWNLDEINFGGQRDAASGTSDSATSFDYEQTLAYIQGELPPTFEDDFTVANEMWGVASDQRWIHNMQQAHLLEVTNQEDGGLTFPTNGLLDASNFAMRFDFNNETNQPVDRIGIMFSAAGDRNPHYRTYINWLSPVGPYLALDQINEDGDLIDLDQNEISYNPGSNTYLILVYDNHLVFYLNSVPVYTTDVITRSKMVNQLFITGSQGSNIQIDNITFWNLDGVEINLVD